MKILVWDIPTRLFHWLFAVAFAVAYIAGSFAVKAINAILIDAMIMNKMNQRENSKFTVTHKTKSGGAGSGRNS